MNPWARATLSRALAPLLVLAPLALPAPPCRADDAAPDEARRVHALLICDTNDGNIGPSVEADRKNVRDLLTRAFKAKYGAQWQDHLQIDELSGDNFTQDKVLDYFKKLKVDPSETLLVYYSGHGMYQPGIGQVFQMDHDLPRAVVRGLLVAKHPRLGVFLTDTCNISDTTQVQAAPQAAEWETVFSLFLLPRGLVDINSVSEGEFAYGNYSGGYFTQAFCETLRRPFDELDTNKDHYLTWDELLPRLQVGAQKKYDDFRTRELNKSTLSPGDRKALLGQEYQTVRVFDLPPLYRFGVRVADGAGKVEVLVVHPYTPAAVAGLMPGDVITKVGSQDVRRVDDFVQAVGHTQGAVEVKLQRGPVLKTVKVSLAPWPGSGKDE